jgi:hypothetical protein
MESRSKISWLIGVEWSCSVHDGKEKEIIP